MESIIKPNGKAKSWLLFVLIYVNDVPAHSCDIGKEFPVTIVLGRRKREIRKWSLRFHLSWPDVAPLGDPYPLLAARYSILLIGF